MGFTGVTGLHLPLVLVAVLVRCGTGPLLSPWHSGQARPSTLLLSVVIGATLRTVLVAVLICVYHWLLNPFVSKTLWKCYVVVVWVLTAAPVAIAKPAAAVPMGLSPRLVFHAFIWLLPSVLPLSVVVLFNPGAQEVSYVPRTPPPFLLNGALGVRVLLLLPTISDSNDPTVAPPPL